MAPSSSIESVCTWREAGPTLSISAIAVADRRAWCLADCSSVRGEVSGDSRICPGRVSYEPAGEKAKRWLPDALRLKLEVRLRLILFERAVAGDTDSPGVEGSHSRLCVITVDKRNVGASAFQAGAWGVKPSATSVKAGARSHGCRRGGGGGRLARAGGVDLVVNLERR